MHDEHPDTGLDATLADPGLRLFAGQLREVLVGCDADAAPETLLEQHESSDLGSLFDGRTEQRHRPGHIEERLVQGQRFDQRSEPSKDGHDPPADLSVVGMVPREEDGVWAQPSGNHRRHGREDAIAPCLIAECTP